MRHSLKKTILTDNDLVMLDSGLDRLIFSRDGHLYWVKEGLSEINPSDPKVSFRYMGEIKGPLLERFRPYKELRDSVFISFSEK